MDSELVKLIGQGGFSVGLLVILGKIVWKVGLKMVAAIDRMIDKLDSHTKTDVEAWAQVNSMIHQNSKETASQVAGLFREVTQTLESLRQSMSEDLSAIRQDLAVLSARFDTAMELTPIPEETSRGHRRLRTDPGVRTDLGHERTTERHERVPTSGVPVVDRPDHKKW